MSDAKRNSMVRHAIKNLRDKAPVVRENAVEFLIDIGTPAINIILQSIKEEEDPIFLKCLAKVFGVVGDSIATEPLIKLLYENNWWVRCVAAESLGKVKDDRAVDDLIHVLEIDRSWSVRRNSAWALGEIADSRATSALINTLKDGTGGVREGAAYALGKIGDATAVDALIVSLRDEKANVRGDAAWALGEIGDHKSVQPLIHALTDMNWWVRSAATFSLEKLGDIRAVKPLILALKDLDFHVRDGAAKALETLTGVCFQDTALFSTTSPVFTPLKQLTGISFGERYNKWNRWWKKQY